MTSAALRRVTPATPAGLDADFLSSLEQRIERQIRKIMRIAEQTGFEELARGGDEADLTASRQDYTEQLTVRARCIDGLLEWTEALDRLRKSPATFGVCSACDKLIQRERLEILPTARTCVECQ